MQRESNNTMNDFVRINILRRCHELFQIRVKRHRIIVTINLQSSFTKEKKKEKEKESPQVSEL
jgi:hypothetical protein